MLGRLAFALLLSSISQSDKPESLESRNLAKIHSYQKPVLVRESRSLKRSNNKSCDTAPRPLLRRTGPCLLRRQVIWPRGDLRASAKGHVESSSEPTAIYEEGMISVTSVAVQLPARGHTEHLQTGRDETRASETKHVL